MPSEDPADEKLTAKERQFVREYLKDLNQTQAAIRAGFHGPHVRTIASRLVAKVNVAAAIEIAMARRAERTRVTIDRVILELARVAFADMADFATWGPKGVRLYPKSKLSIEDTAAIAEVGETINKFGRVQRIKLHDKKTAWEMLARHLGMNKEKTIAEFLAIFARTDPAGAAALGRYFQALEQGSIDGSGTGSFAADEPTATGTATGTG